MPVGHNDAETGSGRGKERPGIDVDVSEIMPASVASLEASLAFARIRGDIARHGGPDGGLIGPKASITHVGGVGGGGNRQNRSSQEA